MYTTQMRLSLVNQRAMAWQKRRQSRGLTGLGMLCVLLIGLDVGLIAHLSHTKAYRSPEHWMYGATLLPSDAGGYILVAIVTFVAAVAITIVCMKKHEQAKQEETES